MQAMSLCAHFETALVQVCLLGAFVCFMKRPASADLRLLKRPAAESPPHVLCGHYGVLL